MDPEEMTRRQTQMVADYDRQRERHREGEKWREGVKQGDAEKERREEGKER